jgi:NADP-dependent aldehyde dehydrogenase
VIVKAHSSHPGVSELVGLAVQDAAQSTGMPEGVFSLIFGSGRSVGAAIAQHPAVKAVGFTGSEKVGRALFNLAAARPEPIPVFAEMSSINPVLILPAVLESRHEAIATGLHASLTLGAGQFCTNPGLVLLPPGDASDRFVSVLAGKLAAHPPQTMLNTGTHESYLGGLARLGGVTGVETIIAAKPSDEAGPCAAIPALFRTSAANFIREKSLHEEVFGPSTLLVDCADLKEMERVVNTLGGQLTITLHATDEELASHASLLALLETKAGRIVCNGFPTGVEVCATMVHGGPYPATTDARFTSVGIRAIDRFLRPVCYQDFPTEALPPEIAGKPL